MGRKAVELGPLAVSRLKTPGLHAVGGVAGLYLQIGPNFKPPQGSDQPVQGHRTWVLRFMLGGKRRDMGLGGFPDVTLAGAREKAREARLKIDNGLDPIEARRAAKRTLLAAGARAATFAEAAKAYMADHESSWRNAKHRWQWQNTLEELAYPKIGKLAAHEVDVEHVLAVLKPIWHDRTETASRLRGRIETVLSYQKSLDGRGNIRVFPPHWVNPARWKDHLEHSLPSPKKLKPGGRMEAMPIGDLPGFMRDLREVKGVGARALEFAILSAARSGEVRGAAWAEVDLAAKVWTIPGVRMKAGREHRVPLSQPAVKLLGALPRFAETDLLFSGAQGGMVSERTLLAVLRRMGLSATVHGFRSTFRDWCGEFTNFPREVAEEALAHATGNAVERAYRRGDALLKRRKLMEAWAGYCGMPARSGNVTPISGHRMRAGGVS